MTKKRIEVSLDDQIVEAYDGDQLVYTFDCVTGDEGHPTDKGRFRISWKDKKHFSKAYHVPMHYAMFFTEDGKALHQFHSIVPLSLVRMFKQGISDWFGSHGCVRLSEDDAKKLFEWAPVKTAVNVK